MYKIPVKLHYSPKLLGNYSQNWWLVAIAQEPTDIGAYYKKLFYYHTWNTIKLQTPNLKNHCSVIRNEEPIINKGDWGKLEGYVFGLDIYNEVVYNGTYVWIKCHCDSFTDIRKNFGLPEKPIFDFHLTIGNCKKT